MLKKLLTRIKLKIDPPRPGDVFFGDPFEFIFGSLIEYSLHGTRNLYGMVVWHPIPSNGCYRLTVESDSMPYYRCTSEVLCTSYDGDERAWKKRSQPRRISKHVFHDMIVEGRLKKI
jgi:hypothetical protein